MASALTHYFVTDVETDGPEPDENSMLSFATVAVTSEGELVGEFECNLVPRDDRIQNEKTMAWWRTEPEAWAATQENQELPEKAMNRFIRWVEGFSTPRIFAARPLMFDGMWIDYYLRAYTDTRPFEGPTPARLVFSGAGLDIMSYANGIFGSSRYHSPQYSELPENWLGNHTHSHRALDDARGYGAMLARLLKIAATLPANPESFLGSQSQ